ncbi:hypothetical protein GS966_20060 [Rhodococcus hoagii]|nr:hypothetical protein [Prescottella equi]NKS73127.1 hypothetical protein [Prescottella equi]NKZ92222.1 hypothetical protein [Prescottella equi]
MQLIIIGVVALVLVAAAAAWYAQPIRRGRRVVANLDDREVYAGIVVRCDRRSLTLRRAVAGVDGNERRADGLIVLPRRRIDVVQVIR